MFDHGVRAQQPHHALRLTRWALGGCACALLGAPKSGGNLLRFSDLCVFTVCTHRTVMCPASIHWHCVRNRTARRRRCASGVRGLLAACRGAGCGHAAGAPGRRACMLQHRQPSRCSHIAKLHPAQELPGEGLVTLLLAAHRALALAWGLYTGGGLSPCPGRQRREGSSLSTPAVSALLERRPGRWARCAACAGRCARWPPGAPCSCWCGARQAASFVVAGLLGGQLANEGSVERRAQPPSACWRAALPRCRTFVDGLALRSGFYCGRQKP